MEGFELINIEGIAAQSGTAKEYDRQEICKHMQDFMNDLVEAVIIDTHPLNTPLTC